MNQTLKLNIFQAYNGYCQCSKNCLEKATDIHHIKANTKVNKKKFPLFINSPFNMLPLNNGCHLWNVLPKAPSDEVCQVYEDYLKKEKNE